MKKMIVCGLVMAAAITANAQSTTAAQASDSCLVTDEQLSLAASRFKNHECIDFYVEDGEAVVDLHGGLSFQIAPKATIHRLSNNDGMGGVGTANTWGAEIGASYRFVRKGSWFAIRPEIRFGYQSSFNSEGLEVGSHKSVQAAFFVENSHGVVRVGIAPTFGGERLTSCRLVNLEGGSLTVPYAAQAVYVGGEVQGAVTVAKFHRHKTANVGGTKIPVRGDYHIDLFAGFGLSHAKINKFFTEAEADNLGYNPHMEDWKKEVEIGVRIYVR